MVWRIRSPKIVANLTLLETQGNKKGERGTPPWKYHFVKPADQAAHLAAQRPMVSVPRTIVSVP